MVTNIIKEIYPEGALRSLLLTHSECVALKALRVAEERKLAIDAAFVLQAAMLHDIGIISCNAPSIHCHGSLPYICHGIEGARMLRERGLPRHALVCERHTGSGLTRNDIIAQNLPLPQQDYLPETPEERLICYADKFFSKSGDPRREKPLEEVEASILKHGEKALARFRNLLNS